MVVPADQIPMFFRFAEAMAGDRRDVIAAFLLHENDSEDEDEDDDDSDYVE
jgi:hypothetical protein